MIKANSPLHFLLAIYHLISNPHLWNNYEFLMTYCISFTVLPLASGSKGSISATPLSPAFFLVVLLQVLFWSNSRIIFHINHSAFSSCYATVTDFFVVVVTVGIIGRYTVQGSTVWTNSWSRNPQFSNIISIGKSLSSVLPGHLYFSLPSKKCSLSRKYPYLGLLQLISALIEF